MVAPPQANAEMKEKQGEYRYRRAKALDVEFTAMTVAIFDGDGKIVDLLVTGLIVE